MVTPDGYDTSPAGAASSVGRIILERYRVEKILGQGGMGEILLAHDTLLNRRVALKRLRSDGAQGGPRRNAILKEARRASQITDRRIASIYDVLDLSDDVLIVMEYVDGITLRQRMAQPISIEAFRDLSVQCVEAVAVAHAHGLIHRDIKPENLMITRDGQIKILDFGIAKRAETSEGKAPAISTTSTDLNARAIAGTPQYMAPEAHYGGKIDERTDIFALGAVFYELLTTRHPFAGTDYDAVIDQIMNTTPPPVVGLNPAAGAALSDVVTKMLAKDPAARYATCCELMSDLNASFGADVATSLRGPAIPTQTDGAPRRVFSRGALAIAALAVVVAAWVLAPWKPGAGSALPGNINLVVLAPLTPGATDDFASFALGATELLSGRLQRYQDRSGFQLASLQEALSEKLDSAVDARKVLGVNLALVPTFEQRADSYRARIDVWDTARGRIARSRIIDLPASKPFEFLDRVHRETAALLRLPARAGDAGSDSAVTGAGTLRFLLQGIGRMRRAETEAQARKAVDDLEVACRTDPEAGAARAWLAAAQMVVYTIANDAQWLEKAEASAREAIRLDSTRGEAHRFLSSALIMKKDLAGSLPELKRARDLNPTDDDVCSRLGRTYGRVGQSDMERDTYLAVIASRPHCWQPWWWLASWNFREGHVEESIRGFEQMIRRSPDLYKGYSSLGGLLVLHGDYDRAIDTLKHAVALRPTKAAFDNLGTAYFNSGRFKQAIDSYNQAFQFGFAGYASWMNLGDAYYWLRDRQDQARKSYAQAVQLGRDEMITRAREGRTFDVMIPANLATVFPKLDQPDSARAYLRTALAADSANSRVACCAALTYWQLGEKDQALRWLGKSVRAGYPLAWLRDSPIFQPWRDEAGFRTLIAGAGQELQTATHTEGGRR